MVDDLRGLFQPKWLYNPIILWLQSFSMPVGKFSGGPAVLRNLNLLEQKQNLERVFNTGSGFLPLTSTTGRLFQVPVPTLNKTSQQFPTTVVALWLSWIDASCRKCLGSTFWGKRRLLWQKPTHKATNLPRAEEGKKEVSTDLWPWIFRSLGLASSASASLRSSWKQTEGKEEEERKDFWGGFRQKHLGKNPSFLWFLLHAVRLRKRPPVGT